MQVLVFSSLYPNNIWPNHGVFIKERMTHVAKIAGCGVRVVAPVPYYPPLKFSPRWRYTQVQPHETIEGVPVYHPRYLMTPKVGMTLYGVEMFLSVLPTVRRLQQECDFDLIDAHFVYPDGLAAVLLGRWFRKPVVVSARGSDINAYRHLPLIRRLLQYTLRKAAHVIAVSQALREAMEGLGMPASHMTVIPNGVDGAKFFPGSKSAARQALGLPDKRIVLSVGGLTSSKGFDLLLKSMKTLAEELHARDCYLVIVGEGALRRELEQLASALHLQDHVRFVGAVPHRDLHQWYHAADVFCLASRREGWPNVVLEALACGIPVVAADVGGVPEIVCSPQLGLVTPRTAHDMARCLAQALQTTWDHEAIVRYAHAQTWARVAHTVYQTFTSVLQGQEPSALDSSTTVETQSSKGTTAL